MLAIGFIIIGLIALVIGGELLVRGASRLAAVVGISPLVIGLTVVAFGTSAPELAVSIKATLSGQTDIAVGNVVGSSIFNVLFILGVSALISPLIVSSQLVRIEVPLMVAASVAALLLGMDGAINRIEGVGLFATLICYTAWTVVKSRNESEKVKGEFEQEFATKPKPTLSQIGLQISLIAGGFLLLTFGARWLVDGSVTIARWAGMSELLIGLTIVAVGTSLPEVATSVLASFRGEREIAVGNVVGSNIFNILCVLGLTATVVPGGVEVSDTALRLDLPVVIAVSVACLPIFFTGHLIARWEGALFLGYYVAYTTYLVSAATIPSISRTFGFVMVGFVVPLTVITLVLGVVRSLGKAKHGESK
ncbi:MAG: sodium:calcium antiporter [Planctomycetota bacterium]|nr:MAG: sodium:calcium antiporter [Planctomycetota bacterium]REJ87744.1 MAG: sodium:calcium antiporter [Planctomycetota bacterium]REK27827.1 MAG: sodium:calcium antiporter [Planctomycetota bacterium]REK40281.1 MAG: sodium:calcium antiporter [Planctomycetota bacterium]